VGWFDSLMGADWGGILGGIANVTMASQGIAPPRAPAIYPQPMNPGYTTT
jgi:hypothetical protein